MRLALRILVLLLLALGVSQGLDRGGASAAAPGPAPAGEAAQDPVEDAAGKVGAPEPFVPSEELPPGSAVSFPVDI